MVDPTELNAAVAEAQRVGRLTERLAVLGMQIARSYLSSEKFSGYSAAEREDIFGMWTLRFVRGWRKLDPERNPHSYITGSVRSAWMDFARSQSRRLRREHAKAESAYAEEMDRISRFIRNYSSGIGESRGVLTMREFEEKIKGRGDSA